MDDARFDQFEADEEWIDWLEQSLAETRTELDDTLERVQELERKLDEITESPLWRFDRKITRAGNVMAPPGTARRRLIALGLRGVRNIPKLRHRTWTEHQARLLYRRVREGAGSLADAVRGLGSRLLGPLAGRERSSADRLPRFPVHGRVEVSIIIPVFNHWGTTLACLKSIARRSGALAYEVVVVDDASTDETAREIDRIPGLVHVRNEENQGFIDSCNRGAEAARGEYLVFLNNDTVVASGWLEAMLGTFREIPQTGLVGAKLVYPDGRLQEAGSLVWRNAAGSNYGKYDDPDHPKYNFAREVDYCSGACIMTPRALFQRCGGFDKHFAPAYYEDADLAFKIRQAGYKVMYQPLATIVHHEGLTAGRCTSSGAKAHQLINQKKFRNRWRGRLAHHPGCREAPARIVHPNGPDGESRGRILIIDHRMLTPDRDAGSVRMLEMIRAIRNKGHHVSFLPDNLLAQAPYRQQLQGMGVEVLHHPYCRSVAAVLKQHGTEYDMVIVSRAEIADRHLPTIRRFAPQAKLVFDTVDLHFLRRKREADLKPDPALRAAVAKLKHQELRLVRSADLTLVASPAEREILAEECPWHEVQVFPTIYRISTSDGSPRNDRRNILFIGGFEHPPNVDAVLYFAREIFPGVLKRIPEAVFQVVGPDPTPEIRGLACKNIEVLGAVPDVAPRFDRARLSVAPLRFGAGVKGKVNQSMALGVPTVVTSIAAEGMYLVHEQNAMIADDPESFIEAIARLWTSAELWQRLAANGRENVREYFSVEAAERHVDELLAWAGLAVPEPNAAPTAADGDLPPRGFRRPRKPSSSASSRRSVNRAPGAH